MSNNPKQAMSVRVLAGCALLTALSVVLSRLMSLIPNELTRFSIEAVPLFIAGLLFGPIPGAMAGFAADFIGCLFSPYGYNPSFCVPPILYGLCAGLFRPMLARRGLTLPRIALAFLPALVFGSVLYQSGALALVYGGASKQAFFLAQLASRSVQFAVTGAADILIVWMLGRSGVFSAVRLWPPVAVTGSEQA